MLLPQLEKRIQAVKAEPPQDGPAAMEAPEPAKDPAHLGKFLSQLMEDPDTRKLIGEQQRMMFNQMYGPLIKQLGLNPKEAELFKDLLSEQMMHGTERASALFGSSEADRKELMSQLSADQKKFEDQIQEFLGDGLYAQYKDYQQTVGERVQLNMFRQSSGSEHPLTDAQVEQLLQIVSEEKRNAAAITGQPLPGVDNAQNFEMMLSEERVETMLRAQELASQQVIERAKTILNPEQAEEFAAFQNNQLEMVRMGISMARKMMGQDQESAEKKRR
jgi:hypothetical protein